MPHRCLCPCPRSRLVTDTPPASLPPPSVPSSPCCLQVLQSLPAELWG